MNEIELRGPLGNGDSARVLAVARARNWKVEYYRQVSIYCNTDAVSAVGTIGSGRARIIIDIRKDSVSVKLKLGNALSSARREFSIPTQLPALPAVVEFLGLFGVVEGYLRTFERHDITVDEHVSMTLKEKCLLGDHFECEATNVDVAHGERLVQDVLADLSLRPWSSEELKRAIERDHSSAKSTPLVDSLGSLGLI